MATITELADEQAYEAEVSQCVGMTGYHHWFFLSALADTLGYDFRALLSIPVATASAPCRCFSTAAGPYRRRTSFRSAASARQFARRDYGVVSRGDELPL